MAGQVETRNERADSGYPVLLTVALGWFLTLGMRFLLPVVLPQVRAAFGADNATVGVAITVLWLGYGLMQFPAGILVDRFGVRTLLSLSLALGGASLGVVGLAPVVGVFVAACGLFGLATGLFGTARGIALSEFFPRSPGRAFGVTLAAGSVGSAMLPFVSGRLTDALGWRLTVVAAAPLFVGTAVLTRVTLPTSRQDGDDAEASVAGLRATVRPLLTDRAIVVSFLGVTLLIFTFQALTAFLPTYLIQQKSLSQGTASALFAGMFLVGAGFQLLGGTAVDRFGTRPVTLAITVVGVGTLAALPWVEGLLPLAALVVVLSSRIAIPSVLNPYIIGALPDESTGATWGLLRTSFFVLGSAGSTVVGVMVDHGLFDEAFYLLAGATALAVALFATLPSES